MPTGALIVTTNGGGAPAPMNTPLLTTPAPVKEHGFVGAPQVIEVGRRAGTRICECVCPPGFAVVSFASATGRPLVSMSAAGLMPFGRSVAVWKPSITNWMVWPVWTVSDRGKKSLKFQL